MDWVITIPKTVKWGDWLEEVRAAEERSELLHYRLPFRVKALAGDKCWVCYEGKVRGWLEVVDVVEHGFNCTTTGRVWPHGYYLVRKPPFYAQEGVLMRGFQGIRKYKGDVDEKSN